MFEGVFSAPTKWLRTVTNLTRWLILLCSSVPTSWFPDETVQLWCAVHVLSARLAEGLWQSSWCHFGSSCTHSYLSYQSRWVPPSNPEHLHRWLPANCVKRYLLPSAWCNSTRLNWSSCAHYLWHFNPTRLITIGWRLRWFVGVFSAPSKWLRTVTNQNRWLIPFV